MKNEEKVDIHLTNESQDDLSPEALARQNYETALRYINIAEHMKQFEDQDRYYHRAIKYLRLSRPYIQVTPLLLDIRKKKFIARASGKISLYEEACHVRDTAKSPKDYYSAQVIFERIHKYEQNHPIPENRVSPELYARVSKCNDSEQQAEQCRLLAEAKTSAQKRRSLFASICFIAVVIALLIYSRTTSARLAIAGLTSALGDHESSWMFYQSAYNRNGDEKTFEKYMQQRYKAAADKEAEDNDKAAYHDYYVLAKHDYKDSAQRLLSLEQEHISDAEPGEKVTFANNKWLLLDKQGDKALLIKEKAIKNIPFQKKKGEATWEDSYVRSWLNTEYIEKNFLQAESSIIENTVLPVDENPSYGTKNKAETTDRVFLLSASEAAKYEDVLHKTKNCWWLRTPGASEGSMCFMYNDLTIMDYGYDCHTHTLLVKPAVWVSTAK